MKLQEIVILALVSFAFWLNLPAADEVSHFLGLDQGMDTVDRRILTSNQTSVTQVIPAKLQ